MGGLAWPLPTAEERNLLMIVPSPPGLRVGKGVVVVGQLILRSWPHQTVHVDSETGSQVGGHGRKWLA